MKELFYMIVSTVLALLPAVVWMKIWRSRRQGKGKRIVFWIFIIGFLSVIPVLGFQWVARFLSQCEAVVLFGVEVLGKDAVPCVPPQKNVLLPLLHNPSGGGFHTAVIFMVFGALEEIGKISIVKYVDVSKKKIETINDALIFSLVAALSFAFVENIFYFNATILTLPFEAFFVLFSFRSMFTMAAHCVFAGIAGYFYGLAKFSKPIMEKSKWEQKRFVLPEFINKLLHIPAASALRVQLMLKGLLIATVAHALFNYLLTVGELFGVVLLVGAGVMYIIHLLQRKSGAMYLQLIDARPSSMAPKDEEVVLELIGMWIHEGKYEDVMAICKRLLEKDPDNNVVKLFLAEAHNKKEMRRAYKSVKALFTANEIQFGQGNLPKFKPKKNQNKHQQKNNNGSNSKA